MVYYMDYELSLSMNFFCWMEDVNMLDIIKKCWEKVFMSVKLINRVIDIDRFLGSKCKKWKRWLFIKKMEKDEVVIVVDVRCCMSSSGGYTGVGTMGGGIIVIG